MEEKNPKSVTSNGIAEGNGLYSAQALVYSGRPDEGRGAVRKGEARVAAAASSL